MYECCGSLYGEWGWEGMCMRVRALGEAEREIVLERYWHVGMYG